MNTLGRKKLYIKSNIIDINTLRDLKSKYDIVYTYSRDVSIHLDGNIISFNDTEIDCSHWINKMKVDNSIKLSDILDLITIELDSEEYKPFNF